MVAFTARAVRIPIARQPSKKVSLASAASGVDPLSPAVRILTMASPNMTNEVTARYPMPHGDSAGR